MSPGVKKRGLSDSDDEYLPPNEKRAKIAKSGLKTRRRPSKRVSRKSSLAQTPTSMAFTPIDNNLVPLGVKHLGEVASRHLKHPYYQRQTSVDYNPFNEPRSLLNASSLGPVDVPKSASESRPSQAKQISSPCNSCEALVTSPRARSRKKVRFADYDCWRQYIVPEHNEPHTSEISSFEQASDDDEVIFICEVKNKPSSFINLSDDETNIEPNQVTAECSALNSIPPNIIVPNRESLAKNAKACREAAHWALLFYNIAVCAGIQPDDEVRGYGNEFGPAASKFDEAAFDAISRCERSQFYVVKYLSPGSPPGKLTAVHVQFSRGRLDIFSDEAIRRRLPEYYAQASFANCYMLEKPFDPIS